MEDAAVRASAAASFSRGWTLAARGGREPNTGVSRTPVAGQTGVSAVSPWLKL